MKLFDPGNIGKLRIKNRIVMAPMSTNLAGLHRRPSRIAEMVSQNLNGAILEVLGEEDGWFHVRQMDGYLGWHYKPYLLQVVAPPETSHLVAAPVALRSRA